jgi:hypothetical protein
MTKIVREEIVRMAHEAGAIYATETSYFPLSANQLEHFANSVTSEKVQQLQTANDELLQLLQQFSDYVHVEQSSTDGAVTYSTSTVNHFAFMARHLLQKSASQR